MNQPTLTAMTDNSETAVTKRAFTNSLVEWYRQNRRDLPWRRTRDPYAIWISETMLQQTQVATVIGYWERWLCIFPTVADLAAAEIADVLKMWEGLGYYARARNLHRAAQAIVEKYNGVFPTDYDAVRGLPGIGPYTAGAICSIAFDQDVPLVDANVIRVLCRVFALPGDPKSGAVQKRLWKLADELIPTGNASEFNQGMMELGALVCRAEPNCRICPVQTICTAYRLGTPTDFPQFASRPIFTVQRDVSALIALPSSPQKLLLIRRPPEGLWGGLWEFPRVTAHDDESVEDAAIRTANEIVGLPVRADVVKATVRHGVTTRRITLYGIRCLLESDRMPAAKNCAEWVWVDLDEIDKYALSSPQRRIVDQLRAHETQPSLF